MLKDKAIINIEVFCSHLKKIGIEPSYVHNFKVIHCNPYAYPSVGMPSLESKKCWMGLFESYIKMLRCTVKGLKKNWLLVDKES